MAPNTGGLPDVTAPNTGRLPDVTAPNTGGLHSVIRNTRRLAIRFHAEGQSQQFLGAFAKLRKATISVVMSACLSVRMGQLGFHWTELDETKYLSFFFRKSVEKIQV
jgi:hypothetical protein